MIFRALGAVVTYGAVFTALIGKGLPTVLEAQETVPRTHD